MEVQTVATYAEGVKSGRVIIAVESRLATLCFSVFRHHGVER